MKPVEQMPAMATLVVNKLKSRSYTILVKGISFHSKKTVLRAYPNNPAARKAIKPQAKWRKAR